MTKIGFIGAGRMAEALIARLGSPREIIASDVDKNRLRFLRSKYGISVASDNCEVWAKADIVILAVKPQNIGDVMTNDECLMTNYGIVISIAAGVPLSYLQKKLPKAKIVRAMPNNPALIGQGITALAKGKNVPAAALAKAKKIFSKVGVVVDVPEQWLDAVTGLSGSGPAFVYQTIAALVEGGVKAGLPKKIATQLAVETVIGAANTLKETGKEPHELTQMVASPGGTTIEGLKVLSSKKFEQILSEAVLAAADKSKLLSQKWTS